MEEILNQQRPQFGDGDKGRNEATNLISAYLANTYRDPFIAITNSIGVHVSNNNKNYRWCMLNRR